VIKSRIKELYKEQVTIVTASEQIGPSKEYSEIATFKLQNRDLHQQFTANITASDVVIADLTHNNPNVHVELGIALVQNKNILRVTGRSVKELGFDIQNLEVLIYKHRSELQEKIETYLKTFFAIKELPLSSTAGPLYYRDENLPRQLTGFTPDTREHTVDSRQLGSDQFPLMRDGAVRIDFEFVNGRKMDDWFGIFFRADPSQVRDSHIRLGSCLAYVRRDGRVEIAVYPGSEVLAASGEKQADQIAGRHSIFVEFENNEAQVTLDGSTSVKVTNLSRQKVGRILLAGYCSTVKIYSAEMVCRDTIEWGSFGFV
jgi:hypothetical protein